MLEVTPASKKDIPSLHKLYIDAAKYKQTHDDYSWRDGFTEDGTAWIVGQDTTYVARINGEIVAVTTLDWKDSGWDQDNNDAGYLRRLAVAKDSHGQGVGAKLIFWAEGEVIKQGRRYLRLDCLSDNLSLCNYYESLGFSLVMQKQFDDSDSGALENLYQKDLE